MSTLLESPYHASAVLGKAYNFETNSYPQHMYNSLDAAAARYRARQITGGIIVCGAADIKALEQGKRAPLTESEEGRRYLIEELEVPESAIFIDNRSTNTPDNFRYLKAIALRLGWTNIHMPMAGGRIDRAAFLGWKVCHEACDFTFEAVDPAGAVFPTEEKLLGDMACALQDMDPGDDDYLVCSDGSSKWEAEDGPRKKHYTCDYYISTDKVIDGTLPPNVNFHPPELMDIYGAQGAWQPRMVPADFA